MHVISYVSNSTIDQRNLHSEIAKIVSTAQLANKQSGITGVLFYENDHFFQVIEGEEDDLRKVYHSIEQDPRHKDLNKLVDQQTNERAFPDWSLDTFYIDSPELINPKTIRMLQELYEYNFGVGTTGLIGFVKKMIDEMDTYKILRNSTIELP